MSFIKEEPVEQNQVFVTCMATHPRHVLLETQVHLLLKIQCLITIRFIARASWDDVKLAFSATNTLFLFDCDR